MKKKVILNILLLVLVFCMSIGFVGCGKEEASSVGPIPNGIYAYNGDYEDKQSFIYTENNDNTEYYWIIQGNHAESWGSGILGRKATIVEKEGKIYFECYKWRELYDIFFSWGRLRGNTNIYLVEYNAEKNNITVELYKRGE